MKCPFCGNEETNVKDTRMYDEGETIKRKRICINCNSTFITIERVLKQEIYVIKNDGRRVIFDKDKLINSILLSSGKNLKEEDIKNIVSDIYNKIESSGTIEVKTSTIAEMVMDFLERIDKISLIRYASVFNKFEKPEDFNIFIKKISS